MLVIKTTYPGLDPAQPVVNYLSTQAAHIRVRHMTGPATIKQLAEFARQLEINGDYVVFTVDTMPDTDQVQSYAYIRYAPKQCLITNHDTFLLSADGKKIDRLFRWRENER